MNSKLMLCIVAVSLIFPLTISPSSNLPQQSNINSPFSLQLYLPTPTPTIPPVKDILPGAIAVMATRRQMLSAKNVPWEILILNPNGTNAHSIFTSYTGNFFIGPYGERTITWSPDRKYISFTMPHLGDGGSEIWLVSVDGNGPHALTHTDSTWYHTSPSWSPDGNHIVFAARQVIKGKRQLNSDVGIYEIGVDGSHSRLLANLANADSPTYSPDGRYIAFSAGDDRDSDLYIMNADGTNIRNLRLFKRNGWKEIFTQPAWSPDGRKILYTDIRTQNPDGYGALESFIAITDPAGQSDTLFHNVRDGNNYQEHGGANWSPDGNFVLFLGRLNGGVDQLYITWADASHITQVPLDTTYDYGLPAWSN